MASGPRMGLPGVVACPRALLRNRGLYPVAQQATSRHTLAIVLVALAGCLAIAVAFAPRVQAQSPTPGPSATPPGPRWPAPTELRLEQSVTITNPDGSFMPPEKREATSSLTWNAVPGFTGAYVLERSRAPYGSTGPKQWEVFATVGGTWFVEEPYPFLDLLAYQRCYRVATVVDGQAGPYSNEVCAVPPPSTGPEPAAEPPFNWDVVKEVVVPLTGDDGRTHYVTLSEDTAGIVRIRLSLFEFTPLTYSVVIFRRGNCSETASYGPDDVIQPSYSFTLDRPSMLVLEFFNTGSITLTPGPKSIYDADGTSLAVYRPGSGGSGLLAACAVLSATPGAPDTGTGAIAAGVGPAGRAGAGLLAAGLFLVAASGVLVLLGPGAAYRAQPAGAAAGGEEADVPTARAIRDHA
ncbi:MAG: hypothetical protein AMXMBFR80_28580 [Dehalococcoidia bacterium]